MRNIDLDYMHELLELDDDLIKGLAYKHDNNLIQLMQNQR